MIVMAKKALPFVTLTMASPPQWICFSLRRQNNNREDSEHRQRSLVACVRAAREDIFLACTAIITNNSILSAVYDEVRTAAFLGRPKTTKPKIKKHGTETRKT